MLVLLATLLANSFENHAFASNLEFADAFRDFQIIKVAVIKIENVAASGAMQMMMVCHFGIETLGAPEYFDNIDDADFGKGQQRAVYCIERDVGIFFFYD